MPLLQPRLNLKVAQRQILTPGLMQMVSVLALNKLELTEMINAEMVENPVLEEIDESVPILDEVGGKEAMRDRVVEEAPVTVKDPFEEIDFGSYFTEYLDPGFRTTQEFEESEKPSFEQFLSQPTTLTDHLLWQLGSMTFEPQVREAAEFLIGNLDDDGYLAASVEELATVYAGGSGEEAQRENQAWVLERMKTALGIVQHLDPTGVGALDLRDCLRIQLEAQLRELQLVFDRSVDEPDTEDDEAEFIAAQRPGLHPSSQGDPAGHAVAGHVLVSPVVASPAVTSPAVAGPGVSGHADISDHPAHPAHPAHPGAVTSLAGAAWPGEPGKAESQNHSGNVHSGNLDSDQVHSGHAGAGTVQAGEEPVAPLSSPAAQREPHPPSPHHGLHAAAEAVLEERRQTFSTARSIVRGHLNLLQKRDLKEISRAVGRPVAEISTAIDLIRTLDPRPGRRYNREQTRLIEPDVAFVKRGDTWAVAMNEEDMPSLRLSQRYRRMLVAEGTEKEVKDYVKERFRSAMQLMRNIAQRKSTILRTCEVIVRRQQEFLDVGIEALRPMMIKEVAEEIGVHPSTVSRAVANKYAHTPQGVLELRYFFSEGANGPEGADTPLVVLKRMVRKLIEEENPRHPLTDDQLAILLQGKGIQVTRRTVAKYREDLHIPSTHQRRRREA